MAEHLSYTQGVDSPSLSSSTTLFKEARMPKKMEEALKREAAKRGLTGERKDAYVYGTMRKTGWVPSTQKKKK